MSDIMAVTYEDAVAVTNSDGTNDPKGPFAALQATTLAGVAKVTTFRGSNTVIYLPLGVIVPCAVKRVWSTGTSATGVVGFLGSPQFTGGQQ